MTLKFKSNLFVPKVIEADPCRIIQRGTAAKLPHGGLPEIISPHLLKLIEETGGKDGPIGLQFVAQPEKEQRFDKNFLDPLNEDHHEIAPGVVYKYKGKLGKNDELIHPGRVLWTVTRFCASYCRFCTRGREVGITQANDACTSGAIAHTAFLSDDNIDEVRDFLISHKEINEVILSGGDPLNTPEFYLKKIIQTLSELQRHGHIDLVRIGTRLPVHNPMVIKQWHYDLISELRNPNIMVHINHPAELTPETLDVLYNLRKQCLANIFSQTVFLKGVNDSVEIFEKLFNKLAKEGIRPYYVFQNDPVYWASHFSVPLPRAVKIWNKLRPRLSGIAATARFAIDVPNGYGKIPLPEGGAWDVDYSHFRDFVGKEHSTK